MKPMQSQLPARAALTMALMLAVLTPALAQDTPVIIRDGSIIIESSHTPLEKWKASGNNAREHPDAARGLANVTVTGPGARNSTCTGRGRCLIEFNWSTGHIVRLTALPGGRGARLESTTSFDDAGWKKAPGSWTFALPSNAILEIRIRDSATSGSFETICRGRRCSARVSFLP